MNNLQTVKAQIIKTLQDSFKSFEGVSVNLATLREINNAALTLLASFPLVEKEHIKITVVQDKRDPRQVNLVPENLYTYLLLSGVNVPYSVVENKEEYEGELGTYKLVQTALGPVPYFKPNEPLGMITFNINLF